MRSSTSRGFGIPGARRRQAMFARHRIPHFCPPATRHFCVAAAFVLAAVLRQRSPAAQATLNGLVAGGYMGLGAIGLTLVLRRAQAGQFRPWRPPGRRRLRDDWATRLGMPLALGGAHRRFSLRRIALARHRKASCGHRCGAPAQAHLQLFLSAIGLALVFRFSIQFVAGSQVRTLGPDILSPIVIGAVRIGILQATVLVVGVTAMAIVGLVLRTTNIGKQMRAFADNRALAEVSGIDTTRSSTVTWIASPACSRGSPASSMRLPSATFNPNFGITLLLSLFAAAVLGGIGNAYGALVGGLVIGLSQEWSTLVLQSALEAGRRLCHPYPVAAVHAAAAYSAGSAATAHEHRLLDQRRRARGDLWHLHARPAAECRASPAC